MYFDVIISQSKNDKVPRAAWNSFNSNEMNKLRDKSEKFKFDCLCEICQIDREIHEQKIKKDVILAAIKECKEMFQQNKTLAMTH